MTQQLDPKDVSVTVGGVPCVPMQGEFRPNIIEVGFQFKPGSVSAKLGDSVRLDVDDGIELVGHVIECPEGLDASAVWARGELRHKTTVENIVALSRAPDHIFRELLK